MSRSGWYVSPSPQESGTQPALPHPGSFEEKKSRELRSQAGAIAAFTIDLIVYPLDTIKTRLQSQDYLKTYASPGRSGRSAAFSFRGLYQGVGSAVAATLPAGIVTRLLLAARRH